MVERERNGCEREMRAVEGDRDERKGERTVDGKGKGKVEKEIKGGRRETWGGREGRKQWM